MDPDKPQKTENTEKFQHNLSEEDFVLFQKAMTNPPEPTKRAQQAAKDYKKRVVHAD